MAIARSSPENLNRLPLVIEPDNRDTTTNKDARLVNSYMETAKSLGQDGKPRLETHIYKRPGLLLSSQPSGGAATGRGVYNWKGDIYSIFGTTLYKNGVSKGTVDGTNGVYKFSSTLGATPRLQLGNGVKAYNYDDGAGLVLINDVDFPAAFVKGWAYLDQTTYVMDAKANIQGSGLNDTVNWDPLNTLQAQIEPDGGVALGKQLVNVIAIKQWTTEVFYDAGNATGSPLGRVPGAKANVGGLAADSVQDVDGVLVWMATSRTGTFSVVQMDNLKVHTLSTKPVERLLDGIDTTTIFSWQLKVGQHRFYGLTSKVGNLTLVLDMTERMWSQWTDSSGNYFPIVASAVDANMNHLMQHESNGKLYTTLQSLTNDDGTVFPVDVYTPNYDAGVRRRKFLSAMEFIGDQTTGSTLYVRKSDDDYRTWSNFRSVDMGLRRPFLNNCGSFYTRAHHFRHRSNTTFRLQAVELQQGVGSL